MVVSMCVATMIALPECVNTHCLLDVPVATSGQIDFERMTNGC
jgi:hypothetical protein